MKHRIAVLIVIVGLGVCGCSRLDVPSSDPTGPLESVAEETHLVSVEPTVSGPAAEAESQEAGSSIDIGESDQYLVPITQAETSEDEWAAYSASVMASLNQELDQKRREAIQIEKWMFAEIFLLASFSSL